MGKRLSIFLSVLFAGGMLCAAEGTVKASSFGFNAEDATECLQKALDSGAKKVIVDNVGKPWVVRPLKLHGNQTVHFEKNVLVIAKKDEFKAKNDCLFTARHADHLVLEGEAGATLMMRKKDYLDFSKYEKAEWRSILNLLGCSDVTVRGLKLASSGGDGIYISDGGYQRPMCRNILIENCVIDDNHRQGISVISVIGLTVRKCIISNTFGTEPQAGIDCETNNRQEYQQNILVEDTVFRGNGGGGFVFASVSVHPVSALVRNCTFDRDYLCAVMFSRGGDCPTTGKLRVENCKINVLVGNYPRWYADGRPCTTIPFYYMNTGSGIFDVEVENVEINAPDIPLKRRISPLSFFYTTLWANKTGKNTYKNVTVRGFKDVPLIYLGDWTGKLPLINVEGSVNFNGRKTDLATYIREQKLDQTVESRTAPVARARVADLALPQPFPAKSAPAVVNPKLNLTIGENEGRRLEGLHRPELRTNFKMFFLGKKGMTTKFRTNVFVSQYERWDVKAFLTDGKGHHIRLGAFKAGMNDFSVTWPEDGVYMLHFLSRGCRLKLVSGENLFPSFAQSPAGKNWFNFIYLPKKYTGYFEVPAKVRKFTVSVSGDPMEPTSVEFRDASGKVVKALSGFDRPSAMELEKTSDKREIWSFTLLDSVEDVNIRFHQPLNGVWAEDPAYLPVQK